jgi:hypothetical protein
MWLYDVSKPTKLSLVREEKNGEHDDYKRLKKKSKMISARDNVKYGFMNFSNQFVMLCLCAKTTTGVLSGIFSLGLHWTLFLHNIQNIWRWHHQVKSGKCVVSYLT